jgi:hypothetical protein
MGVTSRAVSRTPSSSGSETDLWRRRAGVIIFWNCIREGEIGRATTRISEARELRTAPTNTGGHGGAELTESTFDALGDAQFNLTGIRTTQSP